MGEKGNQSGPASCAAALHRADRDVEDPGGFRDGIGLHVHQDESGSLFGGEGGQGPEQLTVQSVPFGGGLGGFVRLQELIEPFGVVHGRGLA